MAFGDEHTLPETTATQQQQQQQGRGIVQAAKDMAARALEVVSHAAHETPKPIGMDEAVHQQPDDHPERQAEARAAIRDAGNAAEEKATEWKVAAADALGIESADAKAYKAKEHAKAAANDAGDAIAQKADEATAGPSLTERLGEWKDSALRTVGLKESEPASSEKAHQAKEKAFEAGSDARDAVALKAEETKESAIDAKDRLSEKAAETYDRAKEAAIDAKDRVKEAAIDTKDTAAAKLDDVKLRAAEEAADAKDTESYHHHHGHIDHAELARVRAPFTPAPATAEHAVLDDSDRKTALEKRAGSRPGFYEKLDALKDKALGVFGHEQESVKTHESREAAKSDVNQIPREAPQDFEREAPAPGGPSVSERVGNWKDSAMQAVGLKESEKAKQIREAQLKRDDQPTTVLTSTQHDIVRPADAGRMTQVDHWKILSHEKAGQ